MPPQRRDGINWELFGIFDAESGDTVPKDGDERIRIYKEMPELYGGAFRKNDDANIAERTLYGTWWQFIKANATEYPPPPALPSDHPRVIFYRKFGEPRRTFHEWWNAGGKDLFYEKEPVPVTRLIAENVNGLQSKPITSNLKSQSLLIQVPMTSSREYLIQQFNQILEKYHPGDGLMRHEHSSAALRIYPRLRYNKRHYEEILCIWKVWNKNTQKPFWKIGSELNYKPASQMRAGDSESEIMDKRRDLGTATRRAIVQANKMMWHALRGDFPRDDDIPDGDNLNLEAE